MKDFFFIFNSLALPEKIVLIYLTCSFASLVYILLKNKIQLSKFEDLKRLPAMWETRVRSLDREDPLEKEMAIHSSTLAWKIPWTEEPDRLQSMGSQRVGHAERLHFHFFSLLYTTIHKWDSIPSSN